PVSPPGVRYGPLTHHPDRFVATPAKFLAADAGAVSREAGAHDEGPGHRRLLLDRHRLAQPTARRLVAAAARLGSRRSPDPEQKDPRPDRVMLLRGVFVEAAGANARSDIARGRVVSRFLGMRGGRLGGRRGSGVRGSVELSGPALAADR